MHRRSGTLWFAIWFVALTVVLGWLSWKASNALGSDNLNVMLAVPVISAMLASQGFTWKRKLTYSSVTLGAYVLAELAYNFLGLRDVAIRQATANQSVPGILLLLYEVFVTTFPLAMLVLFVGRTPALLWSKVTD